MDVDEAEVWNCMSPDHGSQLWWKVGERGKSLTFLVILALALDLVPKLRNHRGCL